MQPKVDDPGHLQWVKEDDSIGSAVRVEFQIMSSCPAGMTLAAASQSCLSVNVDFVGQTQCNASDSGFDDTNATADSPWISVAKDQTTRVAKAEITPPGNAGDVEFESGDSRIATVKPAIATSSPQTLQIKGIAAGETLIGAVVDQNLAQSLNVAIYLNKTVKVAVHVITPQPQPSHPPGGCPPPKPNTSRGTLKKGLELIWDQAAIKFTITKFASKMVNFDFDGDCQLAAATHVLGIAENALVMGVRAPDADINVYYVQDYGIDAAATVVEERVIFIQDSHQGMSTEL